MLTMVLFACMASPVNSQPLDDAGDKLLTDDLRFAEQLANWRYFDLAREVVDNIKQRTLSNAQEGMVIFTEARILKGASQSTGVDEDQLAWLSTAIEMLSDWALVGSAWVYHEKRPEALEDLASLLQQRGQLRVRMAVDAEPSQAATLRSMAESDYRQADATLDILIREFTERGDQAEDNDNTDEAIRLRNKASWQLYLKGKNDLLWAEVGEDPEFRLESALENLVDYQWELTEETLGQYFALHFQGVAIRKLGDLEEATVIQAEVIEKGEWYWTNVTGNAASEALVADLFDLAWGEIAQIAVAENDLDKAARTIQSMLDRHETDQRGFGRIGYQVLLDWATTLTDLGQQGKASEIVKLVADGARSLPEGERARDMLGEIVRSGGTGDSSPSVLLDAARGLADKQSHGEAAFVYLRAAAALQNDTDQQTHAFDAWMGAAKALKEARRNLEAYLAYENALNATITYGLDADDKERAATGMYNSIDRRFRETGDAFDKGLRDKTSNQLIDLGFAKDLAFFKAKEAFNEAYLARPPQPALYARARAEMEAVAPAAPSYERAIVYIARCYAGEQRTDDALAQFDSMLARAQDSTLEPTNKTAKDKRVVATAEALNYKAGLLLSLDRAQEALDLLVGFEDVLAGQTGFFESVKSMRVTAYCQLEAVDEAEAAYVELHELAPSSSFTRLSIFELSSALLQASERADAAGDAGEWRSLLSRAADAMWDYNRMSGFPSYVNLLGAAEWFARVDRHDMAREAYEKALDVFDKPGKGVSAPQLDLARIGLATALTEQREFGRARPFWQDLVARNPHHPTIMRGAARGFGGWLEIGEDGLVKEVPGSGDFGDSLGLWLELYRGATPRKYHRDWWESKLGAIYAMYREGKANPQQFIEARRILDNLMGQLPEYDQDTMEGLAEEDRFEPLFRPLYKYLETRIPAR
jgi:tetratricopeptide (TPR) repeat protein